MHDFIENVRARLGISKEQAQSATGSIMQMLQQHMNPQDYQQLEQKLPGSQEMTEQASPPEGQSKQQASGAGGLAGMLGSLAGGAGGGMSNLMGMFTKSGLKGNQVNSFVSMFLDYARQKAGGGMLDKILQQVPGLSSLAPMASSTR